MNKYPGLNDTRIEYADKTLNIWVGCRRGCCDLDGHLYCYARRIVEMSPYRGRHNWPDKFIEVSSYPARLQTLLALRYYKRRDGRRARIFLSDMCDMLAPWTPEHPVSVREVLAAIAVTPQQDFLLLTKSYERLSHFEPYPPNAWVGVTIDRATVCRPALRALKAVKATKKWVSFEPLLNDALGADSLQGIDLAVVGALTGDHACLPEQEWLENIRWQAGIAGVALFEKDNLQLANPRREFPGVTAYRDWASQMEAGRGAPALQ